LHVFIAKQGLEKIFDLNNRQLVRGFKGEFFVSEDCFAPCGFAVGFVSTSKHTRCYYW